MPVAWFLAPYKRAPGPEVARYCAMDDFTAQIWADNGFPAGNTPGSPTLWSETEILGAAALVKVRASAATLTTIAGSAGFLRFPNHTNLSDTLGDLTAGQRNAILNEALALGYSQAEIDAALPANWSAVTLGQVLRFLATRRLRPRYDVPSDAIICDGPVQPVRPVADVDAAVL